MSEEAECLLGFLIILLSFCIAAKFVTLLPDKHNHQIAPLRFLYKVHPLLAR